jgi:hypothetical protein
MRMYSRIFINRARKYHAKHIYYAFSYYEAG